MCSAGTNNAVVPHGLKECSGGECCPRRSEGYAGVGSEPG